MEINKFYIKQIAGLLSPYLEKSVFVGGSVLGFYVREEFASEIRPTKDIDISIEIISSLELEEIRKYLNQKGFIQDASIICRFHFQDVMIDIMGRKEIGWASASYWFDMGFDYKEEVFIEDQKIYILPFSFYLATKLEAFLGRGKEEPRYSKDLEDITYLLNNVSGWVRKIENAPKEIKTYLIQNLHLLLQNPEYIEAIIANLPSSTRAKSFALINEQVKGL